MVFDDGAPNASTAAFTAWSAKSSGGTYPGGWAGETAKAMDLEELLREEAVRDILAEYHDTLLGSNYSNFYSFDAQTTAPRHYLPWDLDGAFKGFAHT